MIDIKLEWLQLLTYLETGVQVQRAKLDTFTKNTSYEMKERHECSYPLRMSSLPSQANSVKMR